MALIRPLIAAVRALAVLLAAGGGALRCAAALSALSLCAGVAAQIAGLDGEFTETDIEIRIENGTTMYALVREFYPSRMNRWLLVAADIAEVNPQAFRNGDPANMIVGQTLTLIDYGDGIANLPQSEPPPAEEPEPAAGAPGPLAANAGTGVAGDAPPAAAAASSSGESPPAGDPSVAGSAPASAAVPASPPSTVPIGRVRQLAGTPVIIDARGAQRALSTSDTVRTGEMLVAGDDGRIVLAMIDRAQVEVVAGGRVLFERYAFDETAPGSVSVMTLLDGGVRIKTGLIGTRRPGAVSVNTPVATVTVQGTRFALNLCADDTCQVSGRDRALSAGLYAGVVEGSISIANNTGDTTVGRGDVVRIRDADAPVEAAAEATTLLFTDAELAALRIEVDRPLSFWEWFKQRFLGIDAS